MMRSAIGHIRLRGLLGSLAAMTILSLAGCGLFEGSGGGGGGGGDGSSGSGGASGTLVSIAVTPASPSIAPNTVQQLKATGTYSDSSTQDLTQLATWASSATGVATIATGLSNGNGVATAVGGEAPTSPRPMAA